MRRRDNRRIFSGSLILAGSIASHAALGACAPYALGTSRTLVLERQAEAWGTAQYHALPLEPNDVVITFDDGPRPESTPQVLKALQDQCVRATFFMNGDALAANLALGRSVRAAGHSVGMHGYHHSHFAALPEGAQLSDLHDMQAIFRQAFGIDAPAYRFPFLEETPALMATLKAQRIAIMSVDVGIDDWLPDQTPRILADRLMERLTAKGGGILLFHDAQDQTAQALPLLLKTLKEQGYRVVHLDWK
jgi:peptidoglycan/xylan/chitin deacetylase (PgdA/CDA1 family)